MDLLDPGVWSNLEKYSESLQVMCLSFASTEMAMRKHCFTETLMGVITIIYFDSDPQRQYPFPDKFAASR